MHQFFTVFVDTSIDNTKHKPRPHESELAARAYAADVTSKRKGECWVITQTRNVALYELGSEQKILDFTAEISVS